MRNKSGFTLIELLVVVAIIAVLISILLPALSAARDQAKAAVCSSNVKQQVTGLHMYANDYNGNLPDSNAYGTEVCRYMAVDDRTITYKMEQSPYLKCPAVTWDAQASVPPPSYGVNHPNVFSTQNNWGPTPANDFSRKLELVPSSTVMVCDANIIWLLIPTRWIMDFDTDGDKIKDTNLMAYVTYVPRDLYQYNGFAPRHRGRAEAVFSDGAVRGVSLKEWITPNRNNVLWGTPERP